MFLDSEENYIISDYNNGSVELSFNNKKGAKLFNHIILTADLITQVRDLTGCENIVTAVGRFYKNKPEMFLNWHSDGGVSDIFLRLELSKDKYEGGDLVVRNRIDKNECFRISSKDLSYKDGLFLNIDEKDWEHSVTKVTGLNERISCFIRFNKAL